MRRQLAVVLALAVAGAALLALRPARAPIIFGVRLWRDGSQTKVRHQLVADCIRSNWIQVVTTGWPSPADLVGMNGSIEHMISLVQGSRSSKLSPGSSLLSDMDRDGDVELVDEWGLPLIVEYFRGGEAVGEENWVSLPNGGKLVAKLDTALKPDVSGDVIRLRSAGADGSFYTEDDVVEDVMPTLPIE